MPLLEALSVIREVALSKVFDFLLDKVVSISSEILPFSSEKKIQEELERLKNELQEIRWLLDDAEKRQLKDQSVKNWLTNLQYLAYDVEDVVDELQTEISMRNLMSERRGSSSKKPRFTYDSVNFALSNMGMMSKIKDVNAKLKDLEPRRSQLDLMRLTGSQNFNKITERQPSTSVVVETGVYGRKKDKETILELVFKSDADDKRNFVIPIVGMGGIGKTTLAQIVYNDASVQNNFHLRVWVCVSDDFDVTRITKDIYQSVFSKSCDGKDLSSLQEELKQKLSKEKFLIVLDDVWNEIYSKWTDLEPLFQPCAPGSKIIVTTRSSKVSSLMGPSNPHILELLSEDNCLSVLAQHALGASDFEGRPDLKQVAEKIVKKFNGLPLAAKTLGGLLRIDVNYDAWKNISESEIWEVSNERDGIIPALQMSYHHLPPHLKRCFAYCSILPKDYEFEEEEIILLWKAEGFLQEARDKHSIEDLGHEYFRDLLSRSLFQRSIQDESLFVMHDLINDLAQSVAGEICFRIEADRKISKHTRHLSYIIGEYDGVQKFKGINEAQQLRTFFPLRLTNTWLCGCYVTNYVLMHLLPSLRCLRVLSLEGYKITELSVFIGDLKHLRYLNFSQTLINCLPESVSTLYNLETLLLRCCCKLQKLPSDMESLVNLCYLDICGSFQLKGMPSNLSTLSDLQTLSNFVLQEDKGYQIRELENLSNLKGELCISGLENVIEIQDACKAKLQDKPRLEKLELKWCTNLQWCTNFENRRGEVEKGMLDLLQPSKNLKELAIWYYYGVRLVEWIGDSSFNNLICLSIYYCPNCTSLPSIGQLPLLKKVSFDGLHSLISVGVEFFGKNVSSAFRSLESLEFKGMTKWENWNFIGVNEECRIFPKLVELFIWDCPQLLWSIPFLLELTNLKIHGCQNLMISIQNFPKLSELEIEGCFKVMYEGSINCSSLKNVSLANIPKFTCVAKWLMQLESMNVESLAIGDCEELCSLGEKPWQLLLSQPISLGILSIEYFQQIVSREAEEEREELMQLKIPSTIQCLIIYHCEKLEKLSTTLHDVISLRVLELWYCPKLISLSNNNLPSNLKSLVIKYCDNLLCLLGVEENGNISKACHLEELSIDNCSKLISLSNSNLPSNLKSLRITGCQNLQCLLEESKNVDISNACLLEVLEIGDCESLVSLSSGEELPTSLKQLNISFCERLKSIAHEIQDNSSLESIEIVGCSSINYLPQGLNRLNHLQKICISGCSNLVSFPKGGLPTSSLKVLRLDSCEKLQALPDGVHNLNSLQELEIKDCFGVRSFTKEGIPTTLRKLTIHGPNICKPLFEWGLHRLTSLQYLFISNGCPDAVSFPQEEVGMTLPSSLTFLHIADFPKLKNLSSKGFKNLTSLMYLSIGHCRRLESFPAKDMLSSLLYLYIHDCPLIGERCKKDKGLEWFKIAHIPCVEIGGNEIHVPIVEIDVTKNYESSDSISKDDGSSSNSL